ncbi:type II toxin-antitoxin system RelE family toxin [Candidatus Odyssella acanthamoebae]|uniref:type II toxin-antitoxin system RelE family toxin n=1 Tax=Candidatus Odyssella acanthamoebae TaxID=91604 RepID=UPI0018DE03C6|nr:type II toxin-antitoxin system RelE/ParE family toxin [Candidatus Paracaedibacter acanthamoebae]
MSKNWTLIFSPKVEREFKKLDRPIQGRLFSFFDKLVQEPDPKVHGKPLKGQLSSFWSYRIGDYRVICRLEEDKMTIVALKVGHRKDVYDFIP